MSFRGNPSLTIAETAEDRANYRPTGRRRGTPAEPPGPCTPGSGPHIPDGDPDRPGRSPRCAGVPWSMLVGNRRARVQA